MTGLDLDQSAEPENLVIVGAGGLAREVIELVGALNARRLRWTIVGILDDAVEPGRRLHDVPILGPTDMVPRLPSSRVVLCVGSPRNVGSRKLVAERLSLPDTSYATLVHPDAMLASSTVVGPGTIVLAGVITTADVRMGSHVVVMPGAVFTHDDVLCDFVTVAAGVRVAGGVRVGDSAYLGAGSLIREELRIGAEAVVGMGAVVVKDVPMGEVWVGSPATRLR